MAQLLAAHARKRARGGSSESADRSLSSEGGGCGDGERCERPAQPQPPSAPRSLRAWRLGVVVLALAALVLFRHWLLDDLRERVSSTGAMPGTLPLSLLTVRDRPPNAIVNDIFSSDKDSEELAGADGQDDDTESEDAAQDETDLAEAAEDLELPVQKRVTVMVTKESIKELERKGGFFAHLDRDAARASANGWLQDPTQLRAQLPRPQKDLSVERVFTRNARWFNAGRRYFVYQPSGGMSNQRIILEHALLVARMLNRTLVVPPVCPHTSMFWNYNKVEWDRTVEAFHLFEQARMQRAVPVLGLSNVILRRFVEANEKRVRGPSWHRFERPHEPELRGAPWTSQDVLRLFGDDPADVLFFAKYSMWQAFNFTEEEQEFARQHVQLDSRMRRVARRAVHALFGHAPFLSTHVRFQDKDTMLTTDKLSPASAFVRRLINKDALAVAGVMYVATQPSHVGSSYFEPFRKYGLRLVFSDALTNVSEVREFLSYFPQNDIQPTVLGLVEQLVCARAELFMGTGFSTFSRYIRIKRNVPVLMFDQSLLPPPFRADDQFLAAADTRDVIAALDAHPAPSDATRRERDIMARPPPCTNSVVAVQPC